MLEELPEALPEKIQVGYSESIHPATYYHEEKVVYYGERKPGQLYTETIEEFIDFVEDYVLNPPDDENEYISEEDGITFGLSV